MALTTVNSDGMKDDSIKNADIKSDAAIAKSKLAGLDIVNADINASAAIATSKIAGLAASATTDTTNADNIGSGTLAAARVPDLAASKITSGTIATARLGSGTASSSNFLRGDGSWQAAASSPDWQSFQAEMVGDQSMSQNAWNPVRFNAQNWDTNSNYDHNDSNWYYTAPAAGKYWYKASLKLIDLGENGRLEVALYKNTSGSWVQQKKTWRWAFNPQAANGSVSVETTGLIELAASDKLRVYCHHNHNASRDLDDNWCLFEMFKLDGA